MSDKKVHVGPGGVTVDDWTIGVTPKTSTDDHLDTIEARERALRAKQQEELARQAGDVAPAHPISFTEEPEVIPAGEAGAMDDAIEAARAKQKPEEPPAVPIILRDPVTGEPIGSM